MNFSENLARAVLYISNYLFLVIERLFIGLEVLISVFMNTILKPTQSFWSRADYYLLT